MSGAAEFKNSKMSAAEEPPENYDCLVSEGGKGVEYMKNYLPRSLLLNKAVNLLLEQTV